MQCPPSSALLSTISLFCWNNGEVTSQISATQFYLQILHGNQHSAKNSFRNCKIQILPITLNQNFCLFVVSSPLQNLFYILRLSLHFYYKQSIKYRLLLKNHQTWSIDSEMDAKDLKLLGLNIKLVVYEDLSKQCFTTNNW